MPGPEDKVKSEFLKKTSSFVENWLSGEEGPEPLQPGPIRTVDFDERVDEVLTALSKERDSNVLKFRPRK